MGTLLLKNLTVATVDADDTVLADVNILIEDGKISAIGPELHLAEQVIDASGCLAIPGLINGHNHLFQTLTRGLPIVQNAALFDWLTGLYPIWANLTAEMVYSSAVVGLSELVLSGCTTSSDMLYLFPEDSDVKLEAVIRAASDLGIRMHAGRGSMSRGKSKGGLPPDSVVQDPEAILEDTERAVKAFHDPSPASMIRIDVMPCSPFSVTPELMRDSLALARKHDLLCQTHLCETLDEEEYCLEVLGKRPLAFMEELDWLGPDVSFAHGIHFNQDEIKLLGQTGTGVIHCPSSNMRLASGMCPVTALLEAGAPVGLGVDGSSSNDTGNLLLEARQAMLLGRLREGPSYPARRALSLATRNGARLLRRPELGTLGAGQLADLAIFDLKQVEYAGAGMHDPLGALVFCGPTKPRYVIINGRIVVADGMLLSVDLDRQVAHHDVLARKLLEAAPVKA